MFYGYKNSKIQINNQFIYANEVNLSISNEIEKTFVQGQKQTNEYHAQSNIEGSISISYAITGIDFVRDYIFNENSISFNFAGIKSDQAYLTEYSLTISPNEKIKANATFSFWGSATGNKETNRLQIPTIDIWNYTGISLDLGSNNFENLEDLTNVSYRYNCEINPTYFEKNYEKSIQNLSPDRIYFGKKTAELEISTNSVRTFMPFTGENLGINFLFLDKSGQEIDNINFQGQIKSKEFSSSRGSPFISTIVAEQHFIGGLPIITSIPESAVVASNVVNVYGENFSNAIELKVGEDVVSNFQIVDDEHISFVLPPNVNSGKIHIRNFTGESESTGSLNITYPAITITSFSPSVVSTNETVLINGTNFYKISKVSVGDFILQFHVISPTLIQAKIPSGMYNDKIKIISESRNLEVLSATNISTNIILSNFSPLSGSQGNSITINGHNLNAVNAAYIGDVLATINTQSNTQITITVPAGNAQGLIKLTTNYGLESISTSQFSLTVTITSNTLTAAPGDVFLINGTNFISSLLLPHNKPGEDLYRVSMSGVIVGFSIINSTQLSGILPSNVPSGDIYIMKPNGSFYPDRGSFTRLPGSPFVSKVSKNDFYLNSSFGISIDGDELNSSEIEKVWLSGDGVQTSGNRLIEIYNKTTSSTVEENWIKRVLNTNATSDLFGKKLWLSHSLESPGSLSKNAFITGMASGTYKLNIENSSSSIQFSEDIRILNQTRLSHFSSNTTSTSSLFENNPIFNSYNCLDDSNLTKTQTNSEINPYWQIDFPQRYKVTRIRINTADLFYNDSPVNEESFLEVQFLNGETILKTGSFYINQETIIDSGFANEFYTDFDSWRIESNRVKIIAHRINSTTEAQLNETLALRQVQIFGYF